MSKKRSGLRASVQAAQRAVDSGASMPPAELNPPTEVLPPGIHDGRLVTPEGRVYELADARLRPTDAHDLVMAGALLVFDTCGCGGYCDLSWPDATERGRLAQHGPPRLNRKRLGALEKWVSEEGPPLVFVFGEVRWG